MRAPCLSIRLKLLLTAVFEDDTDFAVKGVERGVRVDQDTGVLQFR